ncbi:GAF domain-containing sensor histidine kinase [Pedobacter sp. Du54]|uniref:GAF domain-containing sensor histidine kinase n=1 Tax=Pedobacter anseongensis TaxID=3133439 RepID=UPI0030A13875
MSNPTSLLSKDELNRLISLSEFDLDYSDLSHNFEDLVQLAAKVSGTSISLVNLIDSYTQWSVSKFGLDIEQMSREDSVCQYTILEKDQLEVKDLSVDERFSDKFYVQQPLNLRYYFGVPLTTKEGHNIGALCVLDNETKTISPEKVELLKLIANEIVNRLNTIKLLQDLRYKLKGASDVNKKVAHDIRGPLAGIIGISEIINELGNENKIEEVLELVRLIHKSSKSILDLADEILTNETDSTNTTQKANDFNLTLFKEKLEKLYFPQSLNKNIEFSVSINPKYESISISKNKLLQIVGNLISNAIKFTPQGGFVHVKMDLVLIGSIKNLQILVSDSGVGLTEEDIVNILSGSKSSSNGTTGELGFGFGLTMVKHLIEGLDGTLKINSTLGKGSNFEILLPQIK